MATLIPALGACVSRMEFPVVALMGVEQMPVAGEEERNEARLFYVGATRATQRLEITASGDERFEGKLAAPDLKFDEPSCPRWGMRTD